MKPIMQHSKKGNQLLRSMKPTTRRVVWISSSVILSLTLGLILSINLSDSQETVAATSIDEQCMTYAKTNHAGMTCENSYGAVKTETPVETDVEDATSEGTTATPSIAKEQHETDPNPSNSLAEESKTLKASANDNRADFNDITELKILSFGPNPFKEKISLTFSQHLAFDVDFEIINSSGQAVFIDIINAHAGLNQYDFTDRMGLPNGTYYMTLLYNHKKQVKKLIKN